VIKSIGLEDSLLKETMSLKEVNLRLCLFAAISEVDTKAWFKMLPVFSS
jgi:hypothetical protein